MSLDISIPFVRTLSWPQVGAALSLARRHAGLILAASTLALLILAAIGGPAVVPYSPEQLNLGARLALPSPAHLLGTDENGRDELVRLLYGARVTLAVAGSAALCSGIAGSLLGTASGYYRTLDALIMRVADAFMALPALVLAIAMLSVIGPSAPGIVLIVVVTSWAQTARVVRSEVLRAKVQDFVEGARIVGAGTGRILFRHILPQAGPSILVATTLNVAYAILVESALSYLGLGIQPPNASWGNMLSASQNYIFTAGYLAIWPGLLILMSVLCCNVLGECLLGIMDPFSRSRLQAGDL